MPRSSELAIVSVPPCASAICLTIASPMPVPATCAAALAAIEPLEDSLAVVFRRSLSRSFARRCGLRRCRSARSSIVDVEGEYFSALSSSCRNSELQQRAIRVHHQFGGNMILDDVALEPRAELPQRLQPVMSATRWRSRLTTKSPAVDAEHLDGIADERLQPRQIFVDDVDELALRIISLAMSSANAVAAAFIDVSGVLNSCAAASNTAARSSLLCRDASARACTA